MNLLFNINIFLLNIVYKRVKNDYKNLYLIKI